MNRYRPHQNMASPTKETGDPTPICRCRVLYLGSSVPHITKDGLQGIQEPLKELYPDQGAAGVKGIDSWLSVWSNGMLLENVNENGKKVTRFFPIDSLHYCAAVRYVVVPGSKGEKVPRFLPLDSPFARNPSPSHPPVFASILRRVTGIKVLECHAFICKRETPANALVRCCFHAYADNMYAKQMEGGSVYGTLGGGTTPQGMIEPTPNSIEKVQEWKEGQDLHRSELVVANGNGISPTEESAVDEISIYNGDENHKVWAGANSPEKDGIYTEYGSTIRSFRSVGSPGTYHSRPRQLIVPSQPPPPPPADKERKKKKEKKKHKDKEPLYIMNGTLQRPASAANGSTLQPSMSNGRPASVMNGYAQPSKSMMNGHSANPQMILLPTKGPSNRKIHHIATERRMRVVGGPARHPLPPMMMPMPPGPPIPPPPPAMAPPPMMMVPVNSRKMHSRAIEEPIYMPSARPMSPVASYQPAHFPYEDYYMQQQYATTGRPQKYKKHREGKSKSKEKQQVEDGAETESIYNTGIYKKKGHLNERAFSYSIRQEHRSRSHGSLANLGFGEDGTGTMTREEAKKEREIMQMVGELNIKGNRH